MYSIIAGIYNTYYIFYFLFVHGYVPVCEARDFLKPLTLFSNGFNPFFVMHPIKLFLLWPTFLHRKVHARYKETKNSFKK